MNLPEPQTKHYSTLNDEIEKTGTLKIPQFQREFIWEIKKSAALLDSIVKGYPVGSFIFWKTKELLRSVRNIGNIQLPPPNPGDYVNYVLDGQQRITSVFAALKGEKIMRSDGKIEDFSEMYVDLQASEDDQIVTTEIENRDKKDIIKLKDLLYADLTTLAQFPSEYHRKIDEYKKRITSYNYSVIQVGDVSIDVASDIFTRVNVGGKPLTLFEIMVAKTYDYDSNFDLSEKFDNLIDELKVVDYETISDSSVLQLISLIIRKECKKKTILDLDKKQIIELWKPVSDAIERAVDYFRGYYRIPVSKLLPYNTLIVPFAYFFYKHNDRPAGDRQRYLEDFFWRVSLSGRYSSGVEGKLAQDIKRVDDILADKSPQYDWPINTSPEYIKNNGWFSAGRSYIKAILCVYAYQKPESFIDNSLVTISNAWLKIAISKNYHHFFPKAYLKSLNKDEKNINHILNITIVDDFLNKKKIKANPPSQYMEEFRKVNPKLSEAMKTHLIPDLDAFGIWTDDFETFFEKRAEKVSEELSHRLIPRDIDEKPQADMVDDFVEDFSPTEDENISE